MVRMFVRHNVEDYDTWRGVYDGFAGTQKALGVRGEAVYQSVEDPTDITVTHDFDDIDAARAFAASSELRDAMMQAGVAGEPGIWFTNERD